MSPAMSKRGSLLSSACSICGEPVFSKEGRLVLALREIYAVHRGACDEQLETACAAAIERAAAEFRRRGGER